MITFGHAVWKSTTSLFITYELGGDPLLGPDSDGELSFQQSYRAAKCSGGKFATP